MSISVHFYQGLQYVLMDLARPLASFPIRIINASKTCLSLILVRCCDIFCYDLQNYFAYLLTQQGKNYV